MAIYSEGGWDPEIARELNLTLRKFAKLVEDNEAFADFIERGRTLSTAWWYEMGRKGLFMDKFNTGLFNFNMKNRFNWADKVDTKDTTDDRPPSIAAARAQLQEALKRLGKNSPELLSGAKLIQIENAND
jgi:hypothetical protein